ncbi:hypothetical protein Landi51_01272 [Colletotrichum acutatum]
MAPKKKSEQPNKPAQVKESEQPKKVEQPKKPKQRMEQAQSKTPGQPKKLQPSKKPGQSKTLEQPKIPEQPKISKHIEESKQSKKPEQKKPEQKKPGKEKPEHNKPEQEKPDQKKSEQLKRSNHSEAQLGPHNSSCQALIHTVCPQYLTTEEAEQIIKQFKSCPWQENKQVLWSGVNKTQVQKWADQRGMQTLTTAMGPLMNSSHPLCLRTKKTSSAWSKYMKGASLVFAWRISRGSFTTVLTPPPPERFHPDGLTNWQDIEEPVLKGRLGTPTSCQIFLVHPTVQEARDFKYQVWPVDSTDLWLNTFRITQASTHTWRTISKARVHTTWVIEKGEQLKSVGAIKSSSMCKANAAPLPNTTSSDDSTSSGPRFLLRNQKTTSQIEANEEMKPASPQVTQSSSHTMSPLGPILPLQTHQSTFRAQVDATTQTIHTSSTGTQTDKVASDEVLPTAPGYSPQRQQSICQTAAKSETSRTVPITSQTSHDSMAPLSTAHTLQSHPGFPQSRAKKGAIQVDSPRGLETYSSSVTETPSSFLMCLHLAIIEVTSSFLLILVGTVVHLVSVPWNGANTKVTMTTCASLDDNSVSQATPMDSKTAKKTVKQALRKQALGEARVSPEPYMLVGKLFQEDTTVDEPQAALVDTFGSSSNFAAPTTTRSGIDFASYDLPRCKKKKNKNKNKKTAAVAMITAEVAHISEVTAFTQPTSEYGHSCLGPVAPSTLRKAYWVD